MTDRGATPMPHDARPGTWSVNVRILPRLLTDRRYLRDETRDQIRQQRWATKVRLSCGLDRLRLFGGHCQ